VLNFKNVIAAGAIALVSVTAANAEQYLGAPGNQGSAAGFGQYMGTFVGYFATKPMRDAFRSAAHLTSAGMLTKTVARKDAAGRTVGYTIGTKYYPMAIGPIQTGWSSADYSSYDTSLGIRTSGSWDYQGNGTWSFVPSGCNSQGC
jgi:hypothetical protein